VLSAPRIEAFVDESPGFPTVRGYLHRPAEVSSGSLVLTHGAGSNANAPLLAAVSRAFTDAGFTVLRCDLPFRQLRAHGPPMGAVAVRDRAGLKRAVEVLRNLAPGRVFLGGHSYGGRQASMLAAEEPGLVDGLLLLSYPLHPPKRPEELRTAHFPKLQTPALFIHGTRDPFGTLDELRTALGLIPAPHALAAIEGAAHDLGHGGAAVAERVLAEFRKLHGFQAL
jgi:uncharacterized protein